MSQGYKPEDIIPSDKALLLRVLGQVPLHHQGYDRVQWPRLTSSWLKHCTKRTERLRKAIKEKAYKVVFFFPRKTVLFCNESLNRKRADTAIALEKILFPPFYSERFNEISFWLRNNEKRVRAGTRNKEIGFSSGRWFKSEAHHSSIMLMGFIYLTIISYTS